MSKKLFKFFYLSLIYLELKMGVRKFLVWKGAGYYLPLFDIDKQPLKNEIEKWDNLANKQNGEKILVKLISYRACNDSSKMIKESLWQFLGFANKIPLKNCSFKQLYIIYGNFLLHWWVN